MELSQVAGLTVATTHHAEIKELADTHPLFMNASMEFNAATLKPTYRLIWESTGQSNALDVCAALNFDPAVVQEARQTLKTGILQAEKKANVEESLKEKLQETFAMRDELLKTQKEAKKKLSQLEKELQKMRTKEKKLQVDAFHPASLNLLCILRISWRHTRQHRAQQRLRSTGFWKRSREASSPLKKPSPVFRNSSIMPPTQKATLQVLHSLNLQLMSNFSERCRRLVSSVWRDGKVEAFGWAPRDRPVEEKGQNHPS